MSAETAVDPNETRYSFGGDEWIVVQLSEEMSLRTNVRAQAITRRISELAIPGVVDVCPANAAFQIRIDPDVLHPRAAVERLREIEAEVGDASGFRLQTRLIDVPVHFEDEWTHAVLMKFRDRHQTPDRTDVEFAAELNGYPTAQALIDAICATPFLVSMTGFVPDLPWGYQLVPRERQIEVPKYVRPRTETPERTYGWGGAFSAIYPVKGAGGYQMLGVCPAPIVDPAQRLHDFQDSFVFCRPGDIHRVRAIDRAEYDALRRSVEDGSFRYAIRDVEFSADDWYADPDAAVADLTRGF
jgi:urea carboxylase